MSSNYKLLSHHTRICMVGGYMEDLTNHRTVKIGGGPLLGVGACKGQYGILLFFMSISRHYHWNCCGSDSWRHFIICSPPYTSLLLGTKALIKRSLPDLPGLPGFPGLPSCFSTSKKEKEKRASCTGGGCIGTYY